MKPFSCSHLHRREKTLAKALRALARVVEADAIQDQDAWDSPTVTKEVNYLLHGKTSARHFVDIFVLYGWSKETTLEFLSKVLGAAASSDEYLD